MRIPEKEKKFFFFKKKLTDPRADKAVSPVGHGGRYSDMIPAPREGVSSLNNDRG